jgi:putative periplasmic protein
MKLKYLLVACAALFVSTQSLAAKPSDESAMKWLEIQGISNNYSEKVQRSLEMVNKEDNERLLTMTPKAQKAQMKAVISRYMKNMQDDLSRPELKKQWLDEEKRAVQKVFTQEEVDVTNRFFSSAQGKNILKKIRSLQQHGGNP